jgi:hypothetical protein
MSKLANRVKVGITSTGTGTLSLATTADTGYQTFAAAGIVAGDIVSYVIEDGTAWEVGTGTYSSTPTLTRTVINSSNANAAIAATATAKVFITPNVADFDSPEIRSSVATAPQANAVKLYRKDFGGRQMIGVVDASGLDWTVQPHIHRNPISLCVPAGAASTTWSTVGIAAPVTAGSATARLPSATNLFTRARRIGYTTSTTAGTLAYLLFGSPTWTIGDGANTGGFHLHMRFGQADGTVQSGSRFFAGISSNTATPTNVEPNTLTQTIGIAKLASTTNYYIVYGGSTAQTAIDLGSSFSAATTSADMIDLQIYSSPMVANTVYYRVEKIGTTSTVVTGTLTAATAGTQLPGSSTFLVPRIWKTNNATAAVVGFDVMGVLVEADN